MSSYFLRKTAPGSNTGEDWYHAFTSWSSVVAAANSDTDFTYVYIDNDFYDFSGALGVSGLFVYGGYALPGTIVSGDISIDYEVGKTHLDVTGSTILDSGIYKFQDVDIYNTSSSYVFINNSTLTLVNTDIVSENGIDNTDGDVGLRNVKAYGSGIFIKEGTIESIYNVHYAGYSIGVDQPSIFEELAISTIHNCGIGVNLNTSGTLTVDTSTFYSNGTGIYGSIDNIVIDNTSFDDYLPVEVVITSGYAIDSILKGNIVGASGITNIYNSVVYPSNSYLQSISSNSIYVDPQYSLSEPGDYTLAIATAENTKSSPAIDLAGKINNNTFVTESTLQGFKFNESFTDDLSPFLFQKENNIVFSDHMRGVLLANIMDQYYENYYVYNYRYLVTVHDVDTENSFSPVIGEPDNWPYEWDYVEMYTPKIETHNYIVPKTVINLGPILNDTIGNTTDTINTDSLRIKAWKRRDRRGLSYDYEISTPTNIIAWTVDGDHVLTKKNLYTGEDDGKYMLLSPTPSGEKLYITPSGLIPFGENPNGGYDFSREENINETITGISEDGRFEWYPVDKNTKYDLRGLYATHGNIYITSIYTTSKNGSPKLIWYPSYGNYEDYDKTNPTMFNLHKDNMDPKDITMYEDGTLFVADGLYASGVKLFKYTPRYDYALKEQFDKNLIRLILRENYNNVSVTE